MVQGAVKAPGKTSTLAMIDKVGAAWSELTDYPDCPVHFLRIFATVASRGQCSMQDLEKATDRPGPSISRAISALGMGHPDRPGYGFVEAFEDPYERRRKLVRLTAKGEKVAAALVEELAGSIRRLAA